MPEERRCVRVALDLVGAPEVCSRDEKIRDVSFVLDLVAKPTMVWEERERRICVDSPRRLVIDFDAANWNEQELSPPHCLLALLISWASQRRFRWKATAYADGRDDAGCLLAAHDWATGLGKRRLGFSRNYLSSLVGRPWLERIGTLRVACHSSFTPEENRRQMDQGWKTIQKWYV